MDNFCRWRNYSPPCSSFLHFSSLVILRIPAKAGIQSIKLSLAIHYNVSFQDDAFHWIPAFAGMTSEEKCRKDERGGE